MRHGEEQFAFGPVRQERGEKHVSKGDLIEAINVRQTEKAGVYAKRKGLNRTAQTFVGGSLSGVPVGVLPGKDGNNFLRDSGDQIWERSQSTNTWNLLGSQPRPWVDSTVLQSNLYTLPQPFVCLAGTALWSFALNTNAYEFTVRNVTTGEVTYTKTTTTATGIVHASAAYDGTYVWVFWVDNLANGTVRCHRYTATAPKTTPTATNYYTFPSSPADVSTVALQNVQARYMATLGRVFVVACGGSKVTTTFKRACMHSVLDPATGLAVTAGGIAATVSYAYSGTTGNDNSSYMQALTILDGQDGSGAYLYYVYAHYNGVAGVYEVSRIKVTTATFATFTTLAFINSSTTAVIQHAVCGFVDNTGDGTQYLLVTGKDNSNAATTLLYKIADTTITNAAPSTSPWLYSVYFSWVASGFVQVGGSWYVVTGYDDRLVSPSLVAESFSVQRSFHLRKFVVGASVDSCYANIVGQFMVGDGPANFHRFQSDFTFSVATRPVLSVPPLVAGTNAIYGAFAARSGVTGYVDLAQVSVDLAKTYGQMAQIGGRAYSPGNIPVTFGNGLPVHETSPLLNPNYISITGGSGTDFSIAAVCYAIYDQDGTVWRSAPKVVSQTIGNGASVTVPIPWFYTGSSNPVFTEIYIGINGTPKLQKVFAPVAVGTFFSYTTPTLANMVNGEILYTTGNAPSNTWPVACQALGAWGNRLILAQKNQLWVSKELETGFGPLFTEVQVSPWNEEERDITAIGVIDWNYLAVYGRDKCAVISGSGPDGVGAGNYIVKTLPTSSGVTAGSQVVQGPAGAISQDSGNGRMMVTTSGLATAEAAGGAYDYASYSFTTAAWYDTESLIVFLAPASNAVVAIDYQHPQETAPFGQVYLWTFSALLGLTLVTRDDYGLLFIGASGDIFRPATASWVDQRSGGTSTYEMILTTAPLQVAGLQGEMTVGTVQALLTMLGASGVEITTLPGYASLTGTDARKQTVSIALPAPINSRDTESIGTRPPHCARIQALSVRIKETANVTTQSFEFEGIAIDYTTTGKLLRPRSGRII